MDGCGDWGLNNETVSYPDQVRLYCLDDIPIYCFISEFASLAFPLQFSLQCLSNERSKNLIIEFVDAGLGASSDSCQAFIAAAL